MHCCVQCKIIVGIVAAVAKRHRELLLCYRGMRIAHSQSPAQHKELLYHLKGNQNLPQQRVYGAAQCVVVVLQRMPIALSQRAHVSLQHRVPHFCTQCLHSAAQHND